MQDKSKIHFVLVAGFSSDNQEVFGLKKILEDKGYSTNAVSFYGSEIINDFTNVTEKQCIENLALTIDAAAEKYAAVYGIGISLGGALLLEHAKRKDNLAGVVSVGTPFRLKNKKAINFGYKVFPFIYPVWRQLQRWKRLRLNPIGAARVTIGFMEGTFLKNLEKITTPVLFLHSRKDGVTDYRALEECAPKISSLKKKTIFFENGNHVIEYNPLVVEWTLEFLGLVEPKEIAGTNFIPLEQSERALGFERIE